MSVFSTALNAHAPGAKDRAEEALVANLWKNLIKASGVMGGDSGWQGMAHDAFAEAVAEAVGKDGPSLVPGAHPASAEGSSKDAAHAFALPPAMGIAPSTTHRDRGHEHPLPLTGASDPAQALGDLLDLVEGPARVSSRYGPRRDPLGHAHRQHDGVDIAAPAGAAIRAAAAGVVTRAERAGGYGLLVEIRHPDGTRTRYAHASKVLVEKGQSIQAGEPIAEVGETGRATGPHLHFEVRDGSSAINPERALKTYLQRVDDPDEHRLSSGGRHGTK